MYNGKGLMKWTQYLPSITDPLGCQPPLLLQLQAYTLLTGRTPHYSNRVITEPHTKVCCHRKPWPPVTCHLCQLTYPVAITEDIHINRRTRQCIFSVYAHFTVNVVHENRLKLQRPYIACYYSCRLQENNICDSGPVERNPGPPVKRVGRELQTIHTCVFHS